VRGQSAPSRRGVLRAALAAPLLLASCTSPPPAPPPPDPLAELAARARSDAALAEAVGTSVPDLAAAAGEVARVRGEHAAVLQREVDRERPPRTATSPAPPSAATPPPADPAAARTALLEALTAAEQRAGELITSVPRYRAGLVGSVAAGCASLREVMGQ
jgi:hypothetical protein